MNELKLAAIGIIAGAAVLIVLVLQAESCNASSKGMECMAECVKTQNAELCRKGCIGEAR